METRPQGIIRRRDTETDSERDLVCVIWFRELCEALEILASGNNHVRVVTALNFLVGCDLLK